MRELGIGAVVLGMPCIVPSAAFAQVKVFWTTSGMFGPFNIQGLIPSIPKEKARDITIPISMWVIDHPKGLVVFDTGNNAAVSDGACKSHWVAGNCDFQWLLHAPSETAALFPVSKTTRPRSE